MVLNRVYSTSKGFLKSARENIVRTTVNGLCILFFLGYKMGGGSSAHSNDVFDYRFSGISVWLEPGEDDALTQDSCSVTPLNRLKRKMSDLAETCGGPSQGLHPFQPHATVLYNMPKASVLAHSALDGSESDRLKDASTTLLNRCLEEYATVRKEDGTNHLELRPTSTYAVFCPPFRCSISLFILELTRDMDKLHKIACKVFPQDERHQSGGTLHPHISLIYAPVNSLKLLQADANKLAKEEPFLLEPLRAKYLSVWSTEGTISEWKRIARVEIP